MLEAIAALKKVRDRCTVHCTTPRCPQLLPALAPLEFVNCSMNMARRKMPNIPDNIIIWKIFLRSLHLPTLAVAVAGDPLVPAESEKWSQSNAQYFWYLYNCLFSKSCEINTLPHTGRNCCWLSTSTNWIGGDGLGWWKHSSRNQPGRPYSRKPKTKNHVNPDLFCPSKFLWSLYHGSREVDFKDQDLQYERVRWERRSYY